MNHPIKRKKTKKRCPINALGLLRRWRRGDNRINGPRIQKLLNKWNEGSEVDWLKIGPTLIKRARRVPTNREWEEYVRLNHLAWERVLGENQGRE